MRNNHRSIQVTILEINDSQLSFHFCITLLNIWSPGERTREFVLGSCPYSLAVKGDLQMSSFLQSHQALAQ